MKINTSFKIFRNKKYLQAKLFNAFNKFDPKSLYQLTNRKYSNTNEQGIDYIKLIKEDEMELKEIDRNRINELQEGILAGDRRSLARSISLIESQRLEDRISSNLLLTYLNNQIQKQPQTFRIGVSGPPGFFFCNFIKFFN